MEDYKAKYDSLVQEYDEFKGIHFISHIETSKCLEDELEYQNDELKKSTDTLKRRNEELQFELDKLKVFMS